MRYFWCAGVIVALMAVHSTAGNWTGDFWTHGAAVRELVERPFAPKHPELGVDVPGAFNTPYTVAVAWGARLLALDSVTALAVAGIANLVLLLACFRVYISRLFEDADRVGFYALLFMLLLWGGSPWLWSGFFHLPVLPFVLPYPSTLAAGVMLGLLALYVRWLQGPGQTRIWALPIGAALVVLTHPVTGIALGVGLLAHTPLASSRRAWTDILILAGAIGAAVAAAATLWPYYPFWQSFGARDAYHAANVEMYVDVWPRIWPIVATGVPSLALRVRRTRRDALTLFILALVGLYIFGAATTQYTFGRLIGYALVLLQLAAAGEAAQLECHLRVRRRPVHVAATMLLAAVLAAAVAVNRDAIGRVLADRSDWTTMYRFLPRHVAHDDVVLSDPVNSYPVPTFAGKVVFHVGTLLLVPDLEPRQHDVEYFFSPEATADDRRAIVRKYGVRWLLLSRDRLEHGLVQDSLADDGSIEHEDDHWVLIRIGSGPA